MYVGGAKSAPGLLQAAQVGHGHQRGCTPRQIGTGPLVSKPNAELIASDAAGDAHRDGEDVVDEQGRAGDQRRDRAEVLLGDDVGAAAARVGEDRLAVAGDDDRQQDGDDQRDRHQVVERRHADAGLHGEHQDDLLGGVGGGGDRVAGEDRQRDLLGDALVVLVGRGDRLADEDPLDDRHTRPDPSDQFNARSVSAAGVGCVKISSRLCATMGAGQQTRGFTPVIGRRRGVRVHVVIVGCGRVGSSLARDLQAGGHTVAVVDRRPGRVRAARPALRRHDRHRHRLRPRHADRGRHRARRAPSPRSRTATTRTSSSPAWRARRSASSASSPASTTRGGRRSTSASASPPWRRSLWTTERVLRRILPDAPGGRVGRPERQGVAGRAQPRRRVGRAPAVRARDRAACRVVALSRLGTAMLASADLVVQEGDIVYLAVAADAMDTPAPRSSPGPERVGSH